MTATLSEGRAGPERKTERKERDGHGASKAWYSADGAQSPLARLQLQTRVAVEELLRFANLSADSTDAARTETRRISLEDDGQPDNVLVGNDQRPRVADFGLARRAGSVEPSAAPALQEVSPIRLLDTPLTVTGTLLGTPAYMSPEQYGGEQADSRSDQFSFCAALYEALYKKRPFAGTTLEELAANVLAGKVQPAPADTQVPHLIEEALRRGLSTRPEQRFASMAELLQALAINPQHHPAGAPHARRVYTTILLSITVVISVALNLSKSHGGLAVRQFLWAAVCLLVGGLLAAWLMRDTLGKNAFHHRMVSMLLMMAAQMVGVRTISLLLGLTLVQHSAVEMMALAGTTLIIAKHYLPEMWPVTAVLSIGALVLTQRPDLLWPVLPVSYPIMGVALTLAWSRAARRGPRTPS